MMQFARAPRVKRTPCLASTFAGQDMKCPVQINALSGTELIPDVQMLNDD